MRRFSIILLLMSAASCGLDQEREKSPGGFLARSKRLPKVTLVAVTSREVTVDLKQEGKTVVADRYEGKAPGPIRIDRIFVEEGQMVSAGDPLIKFDDEESRLRLEKARAEQREAEAGLDEANYQQANRDRLMEDEKISEIEAEGIDERISLYQATIDRARVEIELYEKTLENTQLSSPIDGIVTKRAVSEGSTAEEGDPLIEVVRINPMHFVFSVPVETAGRLEKAGEIEIRFPPLGNQLFAGEILSVGAEIGAEEGVEVKLRLANETGLLKGEMKGAVELRSPIKKKVLLVPQGAVERTERSAYLYKIDGDRVKRVAVDLGEEMNGNQVIEKGVKEGEKIVGSRSRKLKDGETVEVEGT